MRLSIAFLFAVAATLATFIPTPGLAADFQVVGHPSSSPDNVSARDLGRIFLKQKRAWPGGKNAAPVDQKRSSDVREAFSQTVLSKSVAAVESYWQGQVFSGRSTPPKSLTSDQAVIEFVRRTPGAVGYVASGADTSGVKVITLQ